jgi:asparagine synthase (glutamine-hydrolysing)
MCGICGFIDPGKDVSTLKAMSAAIRRRGPDDAGTYFEHGVGLAHRRLSIIDLSPLGHQPMRFGKRLIVFNGEIYNYPEIRRELTGLGYAFESSSDTEVILKAFDRWGFDCVQRFIGIFALAIYDEETGELHLCRDRPGVKPLFYRVDRGTIAFGSTPAALKPYLPPEERDAIDADALSQFIGLGYVGPGRSILKGVHKLPQGHWVTFRAGKVELRRYWDVDFDPEPAWQDRGLDDVSMSWKRSRSTPSSIAWSPTSRSASS